MPTTAKGIAKIDAVRGVKINYAWYWNEAFARPSAVAKSVPVRFDPFDARHAYAFVDGRWLECVSLELGSLGPVSTSEVLIASAELRQRRSRHAAGATARAVQLGQFLASAEAAERFNQQRRRDQASRTALAASGTVPADATADRAAIVASEANGPHWLDEIDSKAVPTLYEDY